MDASDKFREALQLFRNGKHKESIELFTDSISAGEKTEMAFLSRGVAYIKVNRVSDAIEDFCRVLEINSMNYRAFFYRGTAYMTRGEIKKAISDFDMTLELKPDYADAFLARGAAFVRLGKKDEALINIKKAISFSVLSSPFIKEGRYIYGRHYDTSMISLSDECMSLLNVINKNEIDMLKKWLEE